MVCKFLLNSRTFYCIVDMLSGFQSNGNNIETRIGISVDPGPLGPGLIWSGAPLWIGHYLSCADWIVNKIISDNTRSYFIFTERRPASTWPRRPRGGARPRRGGGECLGDSVPILPQAAGQEPGARPGLRDSVLEAERAAGPGQVRRLSESFQSSLPG